ncbi:MAG TPA: GNAT family N-acetyltransferase [Blastocatellia bacterium]|nr:GNAT family N-acetyltransferase [Blastocatellia bacterium]
MATAPLTNTELRIIPLSDADLPGLETVFDEQVKEWLPLLRWDYSGASRMIREVARRRELTGFAATAGPATVGFTFYVNEGHRCSVGDLYVSADWRGRGVDRQLAAAILEELDQSGRVRRIEVQCVTAGIPAAEELFANHGFQGFSRSYMTALFSRLPEQTVSGSRSGELLDIEVRPWRDSDFARAAQVVHRSYRGEYDSRINSQYETEEGCAELLTILTDSIWCGNFLPEASRVAVDSATGKQIGVVIASRIAVSSGHLGQISVMPAYQRRGVGRRLIRSAMTELERLGLEAVSLAVTDANTPALHLYESCGFVPVHGFTVFCRDTKKKG